MKMEHILTVAYKTRFGVCSMKIQAIPSTTGCPATRQAVGADVKAAFDNLVRFCETCDEPFWVFEKQLLVLVAVLGLLVDSAVPRPHVMSAWICSRSSRTASFVPATTMPSGR